MANHKKGSMGRHAKTQERIKPRVTRSLRLSWRRARRSYRSARHAEFVARDQVRDEAFTQYLEQEVLMGKIHDAHADLRARRIHEDGD